jgi:CHAT domain-containing protein
MSSARLRALVCLICAVAYSSLFAGSSVEGLRRTGDALEQYLSIRRMVGLGLHDASMHKLKTLIEDYPDYLDPYLSLIEVSQYCRQQREVEAYLDGRIEVGRGIHQALCAKGILMTQDGRFNDAMGYFQEAQRLGMRGPALAKGLVYCLDGLIGIDKTTQYFQGLTHRYPERDDYWYSLAVSFWLKLDYLSLLSAIERSISLRPQESRYHQLKLAATLASSPSLNLMPQADGMALSAEQSGDIEGSAFMRWAIVDAYRRLEADGQASSITRRSLEAARRLGQNRWAAQALASIALGQLANGALDDALRDARRAYALFELADDTGGMLNSARIQMRAGMDLGEYPAVIAVALGTLKMLEAAGRHLETADVILDASLAFHELGADDLAIEYAIEAQQRYSRSSYPLYKRMSTEMAFGLIHQGLGHHEVALEHHMLARALVKRLGDPARVLTICHENLGNTLLSMGNLSAARGHFQSALDIAKTLRLQMEEAGALYGLGKVHCLRGESSRARMLLTRSLRISSDVRHRIGEMRAVEALAQLEEAVGNPGRASEWYCRLVNARDSSMQWKLFRYQSRASNYTYECLIARYVNCLCQDGREVEALEVLEKSRIDAWSDNPTAGMLEACADSGTLGISIRDWKRLLHRYHELALRRKESPTWLQNNEIDLDLMLTTSALELRREEILKAMARTPWRPNLSGSMDRPTVRKLQWNLLSQEDAALEFVLEDNTLGMFCLTREGLSFKSVNMKRQELESLVDRLLPLGRRSFTKNYLAHSGLSAFDDSLAHRLYELIVAPFARQLLNKRRLIIVPDGPLALVPFELLCIDVALPDSEKYLVSAYETCYQNSISGTKKTALRSGSPPMSFLGIGNPTTTERRQNSFVRFARQDDVAFAHAASELPESEVEVNVLSKLFGSRGACLLQANATERMFKARAHEFALIHICAHSTFDPEYPMLSGLRLAPDGLAGEDGQLMGYEVAEMNLRADLVVLNGCSNLVNSDRFFPDGLVRGFCEAGVPSVVGTVWDIDDGDAHVFMKLFYNELLNGRSISAALRNAKLAFIKNVGTHPCRWAPYVLVGGLGVTTIAGRGNEAKYWNSITIILMTLSVIVVAFVSAKILVRGRRFR